MTLTARGLGIGALALLAFFGAACGGGDSKASATTASTTDATTSVATTSGPTGPFVTESLEGTPPPPDPTAPGATRAVTTRSNATTTRATTTTTTTQAPTITSMMIPATVKCPTKATQTITIAWTTKGASKVAISIDSPTGYFEQDLAANGKLDVPFPCDGDSQTYFVVADGDHGGRAVTSRTVKPVI